MCLITVLAINGPPSIDTFNDADINAKSDADRQAMATIPFVYEDENFFKAEVSWADIMDSED